MQILNRAADLDDLTHIFVAEDIALLHGRNVAIIQMQIGAADRRCRDLDDGITGLRILDRVLWRLARRSCHTSRELSSSVSLS